jgi:hypothetical protein
MANIKISELTALTPPAAVDELPVVDVSATSTKKTTVGEVVGIINGDVEVANDGTATISELPVSKLQDGAARQLLQTDAAGTGVEWTSNIDVPGTLDVTSAATFDSSVAVTGTLTKSGNNVVTVGDTGTVTSTMILNGTIVDADINASAAIADTKLATISTAGKVSNSATTATSANTASAIVARDASGNFDAGTISSGRLLVGTSSAPSAGYGQYARIVIQGYTGNVLEDGALSLQRGETAANITTGENIGRIAFNDSAGNTFADILCSADANAGSNDYPGRLVFNTTADGASSPTERMRITQAGNVTIGTDGTTTIYNQTSVTGAVIERAGAMQLARSGDQSLLINRISNDGDLAGFFQDGTFEGSISVSGTTVSYNGAHLSRWSQLPSGAERIEILRGSVLSNIDEMCEWGDEDNEQLNRMKVSDVEGDPNVSGVFQAWDDDDDTYTDDFYCAMTGDFIIRIAEGVTVQRGDLLMSAGDGTAKPQDDDIIRSKTIAKVTSTHITCTYDDGSYCVPCVLMAC